MSDFPKFADEQGNLTTDGQYLKEWIEAQYVDYDKPGVEANIPALNGLSGFIKEYWSLVAKTKVKTAGTWMRDFRQSAENAYGAMKYIETKVQEAETQRKAIAENTAGNEKIVAELTKLKESIAAQVAELEKQNAELRAELEKKANKGGRPAKAVDTPTDANKPETDAPEGE